MRALNLQVFAPGRAHRAIKTTMHNVLVNLDKKRIVFSSRAPRSE